MLKITWGTKVVGKNMLTLLLRHEFVNYVLWEVMLFVEPWLMKPITTISGRHETNQFPSFPVSDVSTKSPSMNDHCCPSRSTASWEEVQLKSQILGRFHSVLMLLGWFWELWVCVNIKMNIYIYYEVCIYIYILCLCTIDVGIYLFIYIMKLASFMMTQWLCTTTTPEISQASSYMSNAC